MYLDKIIGLIKKHEKEYFEKILEFAKTKGYDYVWYEKKWNGYECYEVSAIDFETIDYMPVIGYPSFLLVKGDEIRMADLDEVRKIM